MGSGDVGPEHFVTLFDQNYLAAGLCLYRSLKQHGGDFVLWVVCMDSATERRLRELSLPEMRLLPLEQVENDELRRVKSDRSVGEYCWTVTPFTPQAVMERDPRARRVTYVDADVYFFSSPKAIFDEMEQADADVLITPHAYSADCDQSANSGIYCVQFVPFRNSPGGREILGSWQQQCLEWCYARLEDGKFGDQKYLDDWPLRFAGRVRVLEHTELAMGPWNAQRFADGSALQPAFFHFHGLRLVSPGCLQLYSGYRLPSGAQQLYESYVQTLSDALDLIGARWGPVPPLPLPNDLTNRLRRWILRLRGRVAFASYEPRDRPLMSW